MQSTMGICQRGETQRSPDSKLSTEFGGMSSGLLTTMHGNHIR